MYDERTLTRSQVQSSNTNMLACLLYALLSVRSMLIPGIHVMNVKYCSSLVLILLWGVIVLLIYQKSVDKINFK